MPKKPPKKQIKIAAVRFLIICSIDKSVVGYRF
jgi:hypothetical protein